jgi:hypothetical protein
MLSLRHRAPFQMRGQPGIAVVESGNLGECGRTVWAHLRHPDAETSSSAHKISLLAQEIRPPR